MRISASNRGQPLAQIHRRCPPGLAAEGHKAIRGRAPKVKPRYCQQGHEPCRLPWLHSDRNRGYLYGPPGQWTEELLPSVLEDGAGTFLLATNNRPTLQRFDDEVVPALRAAVSAGRGPLSQRCRQRQARRSVPPYLTQLRTPPKADFS